VSERSPGGVVERLNGALVDRYRVERELGAGGMATVYLAQDLRHDREVAIKVLRPELAAVVGAERFLAEIKTTANLQHPHILPLFDSGEADGFLFYVMPYVRGETLRQRIDREKQLNVGEAVSLAGKVADALDYAHELGIVHRDIKPGNILLSGRGEPLVADFGIALAVSAAGGGRITETGLSLGTPHYMSPEQATGDREIDPRSDVYALGCVLYEMLSGQPPFAAATAQGVLVQILTTDARPISSVRRSTPPHVEGALAQALEKLPADRFESAAALKRALADESFRYAPAAASQPAIQAPPLPVGGAAPRRPWLRDYRSVAALAAVVIAGVGWAVASRAPVTSDPVPFRAGLQDFTPLIRGGATRLAVSSDGTWMAVASRDEDGIRSIRVRRSDQRDFRSLEGSEGAWGPTFSPDGRWIAFIQQGEVRRMEVTGGPVLSVTPGFLPHWGLPDSLVFDGQEGIGLIRPSGGDPEILVPEGSYPHLLPDGSGVLFSAPGGNEGRAIRLVELESREVRDLGLFGFSPTYVASGHVLYGTAEGTVMAVPFDLPRLQVTGDPVPVIPAVHTSSGSMPHFAVSASGTALYALPVEGFSTAASRLVTVDLEGRETVINLQEADFYRPHFSPDGEKIVYEIDAGIHVYDLVTGENRLLVPGSQTDFPSWSHDGEYVYFGLSGPDTDMNDGFRIRADGSGEMEPLWRRPNRNFPIVASPDGRYVLVQDETDTRGADMLLLTDTGGSWELSEFLRADWNETMPDLSPDGGWVTYASDETGVWEVYARSFPDRRNPVQVSVDGGSEPLWAPTGDAIYFRDGRRVMRAPVRLGDTLQVGTPEFLFEGDWILNPGPSNSKGWHIHPDGRSFVMVRPRETARTSGDPSLFRMELEVVVNWFAELRSRMGGGG
jgi:serine/threonine-protein kinase